MSPTALPVKPLIVAAVCVVTWACPPHAVAINPSGMGDIGVKLKTVAQWTPSFDGPELEITATELVPFNDGTGRLMVATLGGTIRVIDAQGNLLSDKLLTNAQTGVYIPQEGGMTGVALHPDFANPGTFGYGKLYTITTEGAWNNGGVTNSFNDFPVPTGINEEHQDVIREWDISEVVGNEDLNSLPDLTLADGREILRMDQEGPWHNMTDVAFNTNAEPGADDYGQLYASIGDGWAGASNGPNAPFQPQMLDTIWGNVIRINPDPTAHALVRTSRNTGLPSYSISPLNPYNGDDETETTNHFDDGESDDTLAEIYANGFRSPFRLTFDDATGALYVGDVGQGSREEVTEVSMGDNAGWGRWEGTGLYNPGVDLNGNPEHTAPLFEYDRSVGGTVIGGYVYRGDAIPALRGKYVFLDYGNGSPTAQLFYGVADPTDPDYGEFYSFPLDRTGDGYVGPAGMRPLPDHVFSVGVDEHGELYLVAGEDPRYTNKPYPDTYVIKLVAPGLPGDYNDDDVVDAADYAVWRDNLGAPTGTLPNDIDGGEIGAGQYDTWRANYGATAAAPASSAEHAVPEPSGVAALCLAGGAFAMRRHRRA